VLPRAHVAVPVDSTSATPPDVSAGQWVRSPGFEAHETVGGAGVWVGAVAEGTDVAGGVCAACAVTGLA
jgi:hypothetical protein